MRMSKSPKRLGRVVCQRLRCRACLYLDAESIADSFLPGRPSPPTETAQSWRGIGQSTVAWPPTVPPHGARQGHGLATLTCRRPGFLPGRRTGNLARRPRIVQDLSAIDRSIAPIWSRPAIRGHTRTHVHAFPALCYCDPTFEADGWPSQGYLSAHAGCQAMATDWPLGPWPRVDRLQAWAARSLVCDETLTPIYATAP